MSGKAVPASLARINEEIARLSPAILAEPIKGEQYAVSSATIPCRARAVRLGTETYIFAVNAGKTGGTALFLLDGLRAGMRVEVVGENRSVVARRGEFSDAFEPLAVHIYRVR